MGDTVPPNLAAMPGLVSPLGAAPNYAHPWSVQGTIKALNTVLIVLTTITTLLRMYTRLFIVKRYGWSDC